MLEAAHEAWNKLIYVVAVVVEKVGIWLASQLIDQTVFKHFKDGSFNTITFLMAVNSLNLLNSIFLKFIGTCHVLFNN